MAWQIEIRGEDNLDLTTLPGVRRITLAVYDDRDRAATEQVAENIPLPLALPRDAVWVYIRQVAQNMKRLYESRQNVTPGSVEPLTPPTT